MDDKKKYQEPLLDVMCFTADDIITTSQDWGGGDIDICSIQDL